MTIDRRLLTGALGLSLVLAACGGSAATPAATTGPAATPAPTTAQVATEEPEATGEPEATEAATDDGGGTGNGALNDLAARLPETAAGVTFMRAGYDGSQISQYAGMSGIDSETLNGVLEANGKTLADVNFAIGTASEQGGGMIYALQVEGVSQDTMLAALGFDTSDLTETKIGGKTVYSSGAPGFGVTVYPKDDTVYVVFLASDEVTRAIIEQLP